MRSPQSVLEVEAIQLAFSGVVALDGVSLSARRGALVAVIGPNGAGKTSLFNCISGVYRPRAGDVRLDGRSILGLAPHRVARLGVARMFQNLAVFEHLSVLENLLLGGHHRYRTAWWQDALRTRAARDEEVRHRAHVERIIELLDLERYRSSFAGVLPYGVAKRIELGRALAMEPALILLDEPAAGLNQEETEDMARYLLDIQAELGVTQVLIEHELRFVLELAEEITVLDFGRMIARGAPDEIRRHPKVIEAYVGGRQP